MYVLVDITRSFLDIMTQHLHSLTPQGAEEPLKEGAEVMRRATDDLMGGFEPLILALTNRSLIFLFLLKHMMGVTICAADGGSRADFKSLV